MDANTNRGQSVKLFDQRASFGETNERPDEHSLPTLPRTSIHEAARRWIKRAIREYPFFDGPVEREARQGRHLPQGPKG